MRKTERIGDVIETDGWGILAIWHSVQYTYNEIPSSLIEFDALTREAGDLAYKMLLGSDRSNDLDARLAQVDRRRSQKNSKPGAVRERKLRHAFAAIRVPLLTTQIELVAEPLLTFVDTDPRRVAQAVRIENIKLFKLTGLIQREQCSARDILDATYPTDDSITMPAIEVTNDTPFGILEA